MTQATEIIGCLINGQNVSSRDIVYDRKIVAKAVFNGDNIYGYFSWVRIATSEILTFEEGSNIPFDAKTPYYANKDGFEFDLGTAPCGVAYFCQIGNGSNVLSSFIVSFRHEYLNTWTSIISPGWPNNSPELGYDEENNVSVCHSNSTIDVVHHYTKIYNEHGCAVGDILEITDREFIDNDHYRRVGFSSNNTNYNGYASQAAVDHIGIPLKYQLHISYPLPPYPAAGYYGAGYRIVGLPNGRYKVSAFMSLDKAKPYHWNCSDAEEYFDTIGDVKIVDKVDVYRRYTYCAGNIINVSNGTIELLIASAYAGKIIPLNFVKLEKLEDE